MKKQPLFLSLAVLIALVGVLSACATAPAPAPTTEPIVLTVASPWPGPPAISATWADWWEQRVTERTNGLVTFENHWAGSLFAPPQMKDAIEQRFADVFQFFYGYAPSTMPLGNYQFALPFRPASPALITKVHRQLWTEIPEFEAEINSFNGKTLLFAPAANYFLLSRMPMPTLADFEGKKIACVGLWFPEQVAASGGVAISNPSGERYIQFENKTIDAELLCHDQVASFKHVEVAKYYTEVDIGAGNYMSLIINTDAYNELPADIQDIITEVALEVEAEYAAWLDNYQIEILQKWIDEDGLQYYVMSEADRAEWASNMPDSPQLWADEMEANGLPGKQIVNRFVELSVEAGHEFPRDLTVD